MRKKQCFFKRAAFNIDVNSQKISHLQNDAQNAVKISIFNIIIIRLPKQNKQKPNTTKKRDVA